ncbi:MAG: ABC transporter permease [Actinomycetota bacterium]
MSTALLFMLLGVGVGAMYAALAMGVIVAYRASGVVNFALGAMAMFPAVVYAELRTSGDLLLPVVGVPNRIGLGDPLGFGPAALLALAMGLVITAVAYGVVIRPLRDSPALTMVIATVGLTIVLQGLAVKSFGTATVRTPPILPDDVVTIFDRRVPVDRFWLAAVVVLIGIGLAALYKWSRFGLATRAAASNEKGAILLGYNAGGVGLVNWLIASLLTSSVGILLTPLSGVDPFNYSLMVIPALGAALAARLRSFSVALAFGIGTGAFQALAVHLVARGHVPQLFRAGLDALVPFLVIVLSLVVVGRTLPTRGTILEPRFVRAEKVRVVPWVWAVFVGVGVAIAVWGDPSLRLASIQTMFVTTLLLSIVVLTGYVGQVSLAQLAFAGYSAFLLSRLDQEWGVPFPFSPILAIAITTVTGTLIGVPALRIRGIQFAIVTFSAALVFERLVFRSPVLTGAGGIARVDPPEIFGINVGIFGEGPFPDRWFTGLMVVFTLLCAVLVVRLRNGSVGRRFLAVRINEQAAAAAGISVPRTKLLGAAVASFLAGVAGVMFAYKSVDFTSSGLDAETGLEIVALAYLGGIGSVLGALLGGLLAPSGLLIVAFSSAAPSTNQFLFTGVALLVVAVRFPEGLVGVGPWVRRRWETHLARRPPPSRFVADEPGALEMVEEEGVTVR